MKALYRPPPLRVEADEFIAWAMGLPKGERYELVGGEVVAMSPERLSHARVKGNAYAALREAVRRCGPPCEALPDGMAVRIDDETVYEPDALVRCGPELPGDTVELTDPVIVVHVVSPSSGGPTKGSSSRTISGSPPSGTT